MRNRSTRWMYGFGLAMLAGAFVYNDYKHSQSRQDRAVLHVQNDASRKDRAALDERVRLLEDAVGRFDAQSRKNHDETRRVVREEAAKVRAAVKERRGPNP